MSDNSSIEWTEATWNIATGCTKVSPGCDHCYIDRTPPFRMANRKFDRPGIGGTTGVLLHSDRIGLPLRWRKPRRIFVNSLSDLFHEDVPDRFIADALATMALAPQHTFQLLTKRHARMRSFFRDEALRDQVVQLVSDRAPLVQRWDWLETFTWPLRNLWLGVTVETQQWADIRIPALLDTPAAVRFLSCEPLLGPVDVLSISNPRRAYIDWVICGGESGPGARPMHPDWARSLRDQCQAAGVAFLFKQWGAWREDSYVDSDGVVHHASKPTPADPRRMAMHPAGMTALRKDNPFDPFAKGHPYWTVIRRTRSKHERDLDGRTWDEFPAVVS